MYEKYSRQSLPSKEYRELLGSAICVFNSNNSFVIENILRLNRVDYNWYNLVDKTSGALSVAVNETITQISGTEIASLFGELIESRNRIVHSFQITDVDAEQRLATKDKQQRQFIITEELLLDFIKKNEQLCSLLHDFRGY